MKIRLVLFFFLSLSLLSFSETLANQSAQRYHSSMDNEPKISNENLAKIGFGSSVLGLALIAIPPVSLLGLGLGLLGFGLGLFTRKKVKKKLFSRLAIILGSAVLFYFLLALGLVAFY